MFIIMLVNIITDLHIDQSAHSNTLHLHPRSSLMSSPIMSPSPDSTFDSRRLTRLFTLLAARRVTSLVKMYRTEKTKKATE